MVALSLYGLWGRPLGARLNRDRQCMGLCVINDRWVELQRGPTCGSSRFAAILYEHAFSVRTASHGAPQDQTLISAGLFSGLWRRGHFAEWIALILKPMRPVHGY